jgi:hypothetical protein
MNDVVFRAFTSLYPQKTVPQLQLKFSGRFKDHNANVQIKKFGRTITHLNFSLSKSFKESEEEIIIGVIHHLLNRTYKTTIPSIEQDLYNNYIKYLSFYAKRCESDPTLTKVFHELNEEYFEGLLEQPNLIFGTHSLSTLGHYHYATDTVTMSTALKEDNHLLKYVLYHELLHKKHGFTHKKTRTHYHTKEFREDEAKFFDPHVEKKLEQFVRMKRRKKQWILPW